MASLLDSLELRARPSAVVGLDLNGASVAQAILRACYSGAVVADAREMPLARAAFGTVMSVCVLEHISGVTAVLAEVSRALRPGGLFALSVPTPRLLEVAVQTHPPDPEGYLRAFNERVEHRTVWDAGEWSSAIEGGGLQVVRIRGFMPPAAATAWFAAYDWTVRPIRGRGLLYRAAGPGLRRFGLGPALAGYWRRRLEPWAQTGLEATVDEACALFIVAEKLAD